MKSIRSVQMSAYNIGPYGLSTSGVSSCIAVTVELENKLFMFHAAPNSF